MQRWRYHSIVLRDLAIAETKLNAEGEKGWELIAICLVDANTARAYFKMPVEEECESATTSDVALVGQAVG